VTGRSLDSRGPGWLLDRDVVLGEAPDMTEQRYTIPVDELVASARVPVTEQVEVQAEPQVPGSDWSTGPNPYGDGMSGDVGGD
jgi:hypothetical protein